MKKIELYAEHKEDQPYPGENCQWCGDAGEFEDTEGLLWPCFCKPKAIESTE